MRFPGGRLLDLALYAVGPAAIFITAPILAQGLGPVGRGELGVAQSVASFALSLGALGQADILLADRKSGALGERASFHISLVSSILVSTVAAVVMYSLGVAPITALAAVIFIPLITRSLLWRSVAVSVGRITLPAYNNALAAVVRTTVLIVLAATVGLSPWSGVLAIQAAIAFAAVVTLGVSVGNRRREGEKRSLRSHYRPRLIKALPLILFSGLTSVTLGSDVIVLQLVSDEKSVGVYAAASSLTMAVLAVSGAFKTRVQRAAFERGARKKVARELKIVLVLGLVGASVAIMFAPVLVQVLLGPEFIDAIPLLRILAISSVALMVLDSVHGLLAVLGQRTMLVTVGSAGAGCSIVSLLILVPVMGAAGAALSTALSYSVAALVGWLIARSRIES